jgi:hypothetical protein
MQNIKSNLQMKGDNYNMPTKNFNDDIQRARKNVSQSVPTNTSNNVTSGSTVNAANTGSMGTENIVTGNMNTGLGNSLNNSSGGASLQEAKQYVSSVQNQGSSTSAGNAVVTSSSISNVSSTNLNDQNLQEARAYVNKTKTKQ